MTNLTVAQLQKRYGVKPSLVTELVRAGVIGPIQGPRGAYHLGFQDVVLLRSAAALSGHASPKKITQFLKRLRAQLPADAPLSSVRIALLGRELVVRIGEQFQNDAGQLILDFVDQKSHSDAKAVKLRQPVEASPPDDDAAELAFDEAVALEANRPARAMVLYRRILKAWPGHLEAAMNLTVLLLEAGRAMDAHAIAEQACLRHPTHALLRFNLGVICEELERFDEALLAYQFALALDPALADAHFNMANLYEQMGSGQDAIRHMSAYQRLRRN